MSDIVRHIVQEGRVDIETWKVRVPFEVEGGALVIRVPLNGAGDADGVDLHEQVDHLDVTLTEHYHSSDGENFEFVQELHIAPADYDKPYPEDKLDDGKLVPCTHWFPEYAVGRGYVSGEHIDEELLAIKKRLIIDSLICKHVYEDGRVCELGYNCEGGMHTEFDVS